MRSVLYLLSLVLVLPSVGLAAALSFWDVPFLQNFSLASSAYFSIQPYGFFLGACLHFLSRSSRS